MAILKIAHMGHPILRQRALAVPDPTSPDVARLVRSMIETMIDAEGTGLAAPQVHVPWRVVIFEVPAERQDGDGDGEDGAGEPLTVLVNPHVEPLGDEIEIAMEACLSVPGMAGPVPRFRDIRYRYQTLDGERVERTASGFHARVIQHECDHLDGILYPMRMTDLSEFGFVEELRRVERADSEDDAHAAGDDDVPAAEAPAAAHG